MCAPVKVDAMTNPLLASGDPLAKGKLPTDPVPVEGHATCLAEAKGSVAGVPGDGSLIEDCRFLWGLILRPGGVIVETQYNDTLGICFDYNAFKVDTDDPPDMKLDTTLVSCAELPPTAPPTDKLGSAKDNGCYPLADTLPRSGAGTLRSIPLRKINFRVGYGAGVVARHIFD